MQAKRPSYAATLLVAAIVAALALLPLVGQAQSPDDGWSALEGGDVDAAREIFAPLAQAGDPEAQFALGWLYGGGAGAPDYAAALSWYERAAEQGHSEAQNAAGYIHDLGLGVPYDPDMAEYWFSQSAAAGNLSAMNNLAYRWSRNGDNLPEALDMIRAVVAQDRSNSAFLDTLGWVLYQMGRFDDAIPPLCQAVILEPGHPEIRVHLGDAYWQAGRHLDAQHQWERALRLYTEPEALSEDGHTFLTSRPALWRQQLQDRLIDGLPDAATGGAVEDAKPSVEHSFTDECQVPIT